MEAMREIDRHRNLQVIRMVRRDSDAAATEEHELRELGEGEAARVLADKLAADGANEAGAAAGMLGAEEDDDSDSDDDGRKREEYVEPPLDRRKLSRDLIMHILFFVLLLVSVRGKRDIPAAYRFYQAMETAFIDEEFGDYNEKVFLDVATYEEIWDWTDGVLMSALFESDVDGKGNIFMYNRLVGGLRMRQARVRNDSCVLAPSIQRVRVIGPDKSAPEAYVFAPKLTELEDYGAGACFSNYSPQTKETNDYGPCTAKGREGLRGLEGYEKYNVSCAGSGFEWWSGERTRSGDLPGRAGSYDASGYVREVLPREGEFVLQREDLEEAISELRRFLWFDEHTRMAVISFALYNGNYNLYSAVRFIFEVTPGGAIVPSYSMRVLKLDLYDNVRDFNQAFDNYLVIVDIALYTLVFRLLILELISWARIRWRYGTSAPYLSNIWNVMELVNITPFFVSAAVRISFSSADQRYMFNMFVSRYQELGVVAEMYITTFQLDSISVLISVLKLFKYFRMSDALNMLWLVLSRAARDIGFFFLVLGLFLVAFSMTAEQMFGESMEIFSTTFLSVSALAQMLLGVVDVYEDMVASDIIKGFAFFIGYICMMFLILLNIFLAILNDAYAKVQADKEEKKQAAQAALEALEDARDAGTAPTKRTMGERVRLLRQVARGRFYRFGRRVAALRRRKDDEKFD